MYVVETERRYYEYGHEADVEYKILYQGDNYEEAFKILSKTNLREVWDKEKSKGFVDGIRLFDEHEEKGIINVIHCITANVDD